MSHSYFNFSPDKIEKLHHLMSVSSPIIRACLIPVQKIMDSAEFSENGFSNLYGDGYLHEKGIDTNIQHAKAHNAYLSQQREGLDKNIPLIFKAAEENDYKKIVNFVFYKTIVAAHQKEMVQELSVEQDPAALYEFLSYSYKSNVHKSGKSLVLRDLGFNGITTYKGADGQPVAASLINDPMKELITRQTPNSLSAYYAGMCELVRG